MKVDVVITLSCEGPWQTLADAVEELRTMDDAELWEIAKGITHRFEVTPE